MKSVSALVMFGILLSSVRLAGAACTDVEGVSRALSVFSVCPCNSGGQAFARCANVFLRAEAQAGFPLTRACGKRAIKCLEDSACDIASKGQYVACCLPSKRSKPPRCRVLQQAKCAKKGGTTSSSPTCCSLTDPLNVRATACNPLM